MRTTAQQLCVDWIHEVSSLRYKAVEYNVGEVYAPIEFAFRVACCCEFSASATHVLDCNGV